MFKHKSRFDALLDNNNPNKKEKPVDKSSNNTQYDKKNRFNYNPEKAIQKLKELEKEKIKKDLDVNSFPELCSTKSSKDRVDKPSFLEKLSIVKETKQDLVLENEKVPDGCVTISYENRQARFSFGKMTYVSKNITPHDIMSSLVNFTEKRKEEYIQNWGEEDYNKTFLFQNYDYDYFNNLDDIYEMELEKLESMLELTESEDDVFS